MVVPHLASPNGEKINRYESATCRRILIRKLNSMPIDHHVEGRKISRLSDGILLDSTFALAEFRVTSLATFLRGALAKPCARVQCDGRNKYAP
jgi:hypothetical protein